MPIYAARTLGSFGRDELQAMLDEKAEAGLSYSVVAHLRWDLGRFFGWQSLKATSFEILQSYSLSPERLHAQNTRP